MRRIFFKPGEYQDRVPSNSYLLKIKNMIGFSVDVFPLDLPQITLTDVNDESPEFIPPSRTVTVNENTQINSPVLLFSAVDRDLNPSLSYSLGEVTAFNFDDPENLLDVDATGIKVNRCILLYLMGRLLSAFLQDVHCFNHQNN